MALVYAALGVLAAPSVVAILSRAANSHGCLAHLPACLVCSPCTMFGRFECNLPALSQGSLGSGRSKTGGHLAARGAGLFQGLLRRALRWDLRLCGGTAVLGQAGDMLRAPGPFALGNRHGHTFFIAVTVGTRFLRGPAPGERSQSRIRLVFWLAACSSRVRQLDVFIWPSHLLAVFSTGCYAA